ncbi:MAG: nicotinate phosphoribosyltransferase, partial [Gammaproteobacteria bacterium]|nr:nicotinate phosphoribosyltransferase [Gammaproteobacteria bacterium]
VPAVRRILDDGGCRDLTIFLSGSLDEYSLTGPLRGSPADGYGIGTHLDVSADAPYFDCAYKIQEYAGVARRKRSPGKETWPGRKQVFRQLDDAGRMIGDMLVEEGEKAGGRPLIETVMQSGSRIVPSPSLESIRKHSAAELARLGNELRGTETGARYPVSVSNRLRALAASVDSEAH